MSRCYDCGVCGFAEEVKFNEQFCKFLCKNCLKKRKERGKDEQTKGNKDK